ncbi:MAG: hypothetical protein KER_03137 [Kerstersia gyiorum]|uniref:hypothetical protein n=1 Tax=Kerstersia gyiorum TaxID=206506 RepID=UPI0030D175B9
MTAMSKRDYRMLEGTVVASVGDSVTLSSGTQSHTFTVALSVAEQMELGHVVRLLSDARHDIVRIYDVSDARMLYEKGGQTTRAAAGALAIQTGVMCAIPFLGQVIALLLILPMVIGRALGYDAANARYIVRVAAFTFAIYLSLSLAGLVWGSWLLALLGPFVVVILGMRLILLREHELMQSLNERVSRPASV